CRSRRTRRRPGRATSRRASRRSGARSPAASSRATSPPSSAAAGRRTSTRTPDPGEAAKGSGGAHRMWAVPEEGEEVGYFKDADEVYATLGKLMRDIASDEELGLKFRRADTIVRYEYRNPDAVVTVRLQEGQDSQVDF